MSDENYKKLVREWFSKANDDLCFAQAGFKETGIASDTCFLCHQVVEKYLKGYLTSLRIEPIRTHILSELLNACIQQAKDFMEINEDCEFLNRFYNPTRYPGGVFLDFSKETAEHALQKAENIVSFVKKKFIADQN